MDPDGVIQLIIVFSLLCLSAFFSSAETALTVSNRIYIKSLADDGDRRAVSLLKVFERSRKMLTTILILNNIVNLSASAITAVLTAKMSGSYWVGIGTGIITLLIIIFGEVVPKTLATLDAEKLALNYAKIIYAFMKIFTPVFFIVEGFSWVIFHLLGKDPNAKSREITANELITFVDASHEDGVIEHDEHKMIRNVFDFGDEMAKDVMVPRVDMTIIHVDSSYWQLRDLFRQSLYTRIPVYESDVSTIIGIVNIKDLILVDDPNNFSMRPIIREVFYTYEFRKTADLMVEMRDSSNNMAIVLDEYGTTVGLVTMEDLLEEIVGEIRDEYDEDEMNLVKNLGAGEYLLDGSMKLDDINDAIGTEFQSEDFDSVGGLMIEQLKRFPETDEQVTLPDGAVLKATLITENHIEEVWLKLPEENKDERKDGE